MTSNPERDRTETERHAHAVDAQGAPPREGRVDALAGDEPDGIPMTGEEDPFVEVEGFRDACPVADPEGEAEAHPS
jgi:hypothetical protein